MVYEDEDFIDDASFADEKEEKPLKLSKKQKKLLKSASKVEKNVIKKESQVTSRDRVQQKIRDYLFTGRCANMETYMMENVATSKVPHPWIAEPWSEKRLKRAISRCIKLHLRKAFGKLNAIDLEIPQKCQEAATSISQLNDELVSSILFVANFSKDIDIAAASTCVRYMVRHENISSALEISEVETACTIDGCQHRSTHPRYIVLEDGKYGESLDFDGTATQSQKVVTMCREHCVFFELMCTFRHMAWNIYNNCLAIVRQHNKQASAEDISFDNFRAWLPPSFESRLVTSYMAKYHLLWAFGSSDDWLSRGFTMQPFFKRSGGHVV